MQTFISFDEALEIVLGQAQCLGSEQCSIDDALGRILATDIKSEDNIPPFASSAMDGYAVQWQDTLEVGRELTIVDHIPAGKISEIPLGAGQCARIMTGAPVPEGADAIIPREVATEKGSLVSFSSSAQKGKHIRPAAEDVRKGDLVFRRGIRITPPVIGMLATLGKSLVQVVQKPEVVVFSTGDEIVAPHETPAAGQIRNSNGPTLRAQVLLAGGACSKYVHIPDDPKAIRKAIKDHASADIMVFSGGVSVGDHDHVKPVLEGLGMELLFWKVRQRPGKPLAFGRLGNTLVLGLPGNPVSSSMCFMMYGQPLIHACLGLEPVLSKTKFKGAEMAVLEHDVDKVENLHYFARGIMEQQESGIQTVRLAGPQGSNLFGSVVRANCVVHLPEGTAVLQKGDFVGIERLGW